MSVKRPIRKKAQRESRRLDPGKQPVMGTPRKNRATAGHRGQRFACIFNNVSSGMCEAAEAAVNL